MQNSVWQYSKMQQRGKGPMPETQHENGGTTATIERTVKIGDVLRQLPGERTLRKVDSDTGIPNSYIIHLEIGASKWGAKTLIRLAAYYGVNACDLIRQAGLVKAEYLNPECERDDMERSYRFQLDTPRLKACHQPEAKRLVVEGYQPLAGNRLL